MHFLRQRPWLAASASSAFLCLLILANIALATKGSLITNKVFFDIKITDEEPGHVELGLYGKTDWTPF